MAEGPITRARAKKLKESCGNLATFIVEEIHQELAKEDKTKSIGFSLEIKQPKSLFQLQWR